MELTMQSKPVSWLKCVLSEVCRQEETSEAIVPDSLPDIGYILDAHASAVLREKELRNDSVTYWEEYGAESYIFRRTRSLCRIVWTIMFLLP